MLTFIEERRRRIRKAREEAHSEMLEILRRDPRIDAEIRNNPEIRKALQDLGVDLHDNEKNGGA